MSRIKVRSHVGQDGILHLDIPVEMANEEIEVTLTIQRVTPQNRENMKLGSSFFDLST
jgi:hypothetical protein